MATVPPILRSVIVCDDIRQVPDGVRVTWQGVAHTIQAKPGESFPITHPELCVYVVFTGGVGNGEVQVVVVDADTGQDMFGSPVHEYRHPFDRHAVAGLSFRLRRCVFHRPGLYWVEFRHDGLTLHQTPLIVR